MINPAILGRLLLVFFLTWLAPHVASAHASERVHHMRAHHHHHASVVRHHRGHERVFAVRGHRRGGEKVFGISERLPILAPALVAEEDRYIGRPNPTGFRGPWCGEFLGMVARRLGYFVPAGYRLAINWLGAGPRLSAPRPGAYAVRRGHVALVKAVLPGGRIVTDNGNFNHHVGRAIERASRYMAFVAPRRA